MNPYEGESSTIDEQPSGADQMSIGAEPFRLSELLSKLLTGKSSGERTPTDILPLLVTLMTMGVSGVPGAAMRGLAGSTEVPAALDTFAPRAGDILSAPATVRGFNPYAGYSPVEINTTGISGLSPRSLAQRVMGQLNPDVANRYGLGVELGQADASGNAREVLKYLSQTHGHPVYPGLGLGTSPANPNDLGAAAEILRNLYRVGIQ